MPIHVHIPIRLRVDAAAIEEPGAALEAALDAAVRRALTRSREVVLEPRGTFVEPRLEAPTTEWSGGGAGAVSHATRRSFEIWLRTVLRAAAEAEVSAGVAKLRRWDEPLPPNPSERIDRARYDRVANRYRVASYGKPSDLPETDEAVQVPVHWFDFFDDKDSVDAIKLMRDMAYRHYRFDLADEKCPFIAFLGRYPPTGKDAPWRFILLLYVKTDAGSTKFVFDTSFNVGADYQAGFPYSGVYRLNYVFGGVDELYATYRANGVPKAREKAEADAQLVVEGRLGVLTTPTGLNWVLVFPKNPGEAMAKEVESASAKFSNVPVLPIADLRMKDLAPAPQDERPLERPLPLGPSGGAEDAGKEGEHDGPGEGEQGQGDSEGARPSRHRPVYPPAKGDPADIPCESFLGEPPIKEFAEEDQKVLRDRIKTIAYRLQIKPCEYAGNFALMAAEIIGHRCGAVGRFSSGVAGELRATAGDGNLGSVDFKPATMGGMNVMRYLARTVPYITALRDEICRVLAMPENAAKIEDTYENNAIGWQLHLFIELSDWMRWSIGWMFAFSCQLSLLQLLNASAGEIQKRLDRFDTGYGAFFEQVVRMLLFDVAELERMAEELNTAQAAKLDGGSVAREIFATWKRGHRLVGDTDVLADEAFEHGEVSDPAKLDGAWTELDQAVAATMTVADEEDAPPAADAGKIVQRGDKLAIVDKHGTAWTAEELQQAIAMAKGTAQAVDPLVKQIFDLPGTMERFKAEPKRIRAHAFALLTEMKQKNAEITAKTLDDDLFAFTRGPLGDEEGHTDPRFMHTLTGIHKIVYEDLLPEFMGDGYFAQGIDSLFNGRKGFEAVVEFFQFLGSALLAVLCAPLGMVLDATVAEYEREKAEELRDLHRALIDPELVVSQLEVQMGLFFGELGLALAVIPLAGKVLKKSFAAGKVLLKEGLKAGLKSVGKEILEKVIKAALEQLKKDLLMAFIKELAESFVMDQVMKAIVEPFVEEISRGLDSVPLLEAGGDGAVSSDDAVASDDALPVFPDDE